MIKKLFFLLCIFAIAIYYGTTIVRKQYKIMEIGRELASLDYKKSDLEAKIDKLKLAKAKILLPQYLQKIAEQNKTHTARAEQFIVLSTELKRQIADQNKKKKKKKK
jgi:hypothetical protein